MYCFILKNTIKRYLLNKSLFCILVIMNFICLFDGKVSINTYFCECWRWTVQWTLTFQDGEGKWGHSQARSQPQSWLKVQSVCVNLSSFSLRAQSELLKAYCGLKNLYCKQENRRRQESNTNPRFLTRGLFLQRWLWREKYLVVNWAHLHWYN